MSIGKWLCAACGTRCGGWFSSVNGWKCTNPMCGEITCSKCVTGWLSRKCPRCAAAAVQAPL